MVATSRRSGGWESVGAQLTCRGSGFVQHCAQADPAGKPRSAPELERYRAERVGWADEGGPTFCCRSNFYRWTKPLSRQIS